MDFDSLHLKYKNFFYHFKKYSRIKYDNVFFVAIDAEWHRVGNKNNVLSYQVATASNRRTKNIFIRMKPGERLKLRDLIERGIRSVYLGELPSTLNKVKNLVVLISHHFLGEWTVLADRENKEITKRLMLIRKTVVTDAHSIKQTIDKRVKLDIKFYDTILLAPAKYKSLKNLSALLGEPDKGKIPISQYHIENMHILLEEDPKRFKEYALRDTEVTLQLFFLLQSSLIESAGTRFRLYKTIASAGVEGFLNANPEFKKYRKSLEKKFKDIHKFDRRKEDNYQQDYKFYKSFMSIKSSYYGGRNEGFFVGNTENYPETKNRFYVDIDFSGCYPTAMALCPQVDLNGDITHIPIDYELSDETIKVLEKENVPLTNLLNAQEALYMGKSPKSHRKYVRAFNNNLMRPENKNHGEKIRSVATVKDDTLIKKWKKKWENAKKGKDTSIERYLIPGAAEILFKFSEDTEFPCLPVHHKDYGLIYPLEGKTVATASEILLALDMKADIEPLTSIEFPMEMETFSDLEDPSDQDEIGLPLRFAKIHLSRLAKERKDYKDKLKKLNEKKHLTDQDKNDKTTYQIYEKMIKEIMNSFYGKFAQGLNMKRNYRPSTGEITALVPSKITDPLTASLVTSLARAALSATLFSITEFNRNRKDEEKIVVISATTDGLLIGLPCEEGFSVKDKFYDVKDGEPELKNGDEEALIEVLRFAGCDGLMDIINSHLSIKQMRYSRQILTDNNQILEIKHMADQVYSVKTRGQIGRFNSKEVSILAKFGQKPPLTEIMEELFDDKREAGEKYKELQDEGGFKRRKVEADWLLEQLEKTENGEEIIIEYPFHKLIGFRDIYESNGKYDLIGTVDQRKLNTDFDWKRKLEWSDNNQSSVSPFSKPFKNLPEMLHHRNHMQAIRKTGYIAKNEKVLKRVETQGRKTRFRSGEASAVTVMFLRGLLQEKIPTEKKLPPYKIIADELNDIWKVKNLSRVSPRTWKTHNIQYAKKGAWEPGIVRMTTVLKDLVETLSNTFGTDPEETTALLFDISEFKLHQSELIAEVISAIISGPKNIIPPFVDMHDKGLLPNLEQIKDRFRNQLTERQLKEMLSKKFIPHSRPFYDFQELKDIFRSLHMKAREAEKCARAIAETAKPTSARKNPSEKLCTKHFYLALQAYQKDHGLSLNKDVFRTLKFFKLSRDQYRKLRDQRPIYHGLKDTAANRRQIKKMASRLNLEATYFLNNLIGK